MTNASSRASDFARPPKKRSRWLRYALTTVGTLFVALTGLILFLSSPQIFGLATVTSTRTAAVKVQVANLVLHIPRNIVDFPPDKKKPDPAISLILLWPTLEGRSDVNMNEFMKVPGHGRRLRMLIQDISGQPTFVDRYKFRRLDLGEMAWQKAPVDLIKGTQKSPDDFPRARRQDLYIEGEIETPESFIECGVEGVAPVPGCSHIFMHQGLLFQISYDKSFLPEWKSIRGRITKLFDGLIEAKS